MIYAYIQQEVKILIPAGIFTWTQRDASQADRDASDAKDLMEEVHRLGLIGSNLGPKPKMWSFYFFNPVASGNDY